MQKDGREAQFDLVLNAVVNLWKCRCHLVKKSEKVKKEEGCFADRPTHNGKSKANFVLLERF